MIVEKENKHFWVPVVSKTKETLMPCHPARARQLVRAGKAKRRFNKGMFYIQLTDREIGDKQPIAIGIDPGSKKEGFSVKSEKRTFLNIQADAVVHVKNAVETRKNMRRARRLRKTPCRKDKTNRKRGGLPPSTRARWQWKLRICNWLSKLYPIETFVVEDIKAKTKKGKRAWNASFSPLEIGKKWFYSALKTLGKVITKTGIQTWKIRESLGLHKSKNKLSEDFNAHCVDSWCLSNDYVGGHVRPDYTKLVCISPIVAVRRQLHRFKPAKGGFRTRYGGTRIYTLRKSSLVKHKKRGVVYIGGMNADRISLHNIRTGKRICHNAKFHDCVFLTYNSWRVRFISG